MKNLFLSVLIVPAALQPFAAQADESKLKSMGLGVFLSQSPYAGADSSVSPIPLVNYDEGRLFIRGLTGGMHLHERDGFGLDTIISARFDGIDADDFGRNELAENGIDRDLLENRDDGVDLGLRATWQGSAGELQASAQGDVSSASEGFELALEYGYPLHMAGATVTPSVKVSHMSDDLANYYYGILADEEARGVMSYRPGSVAVPSLAVGISKLFGRSLLLNAGASYQHLPGNLSDSPLAGSDAGQFGMKVGLSWVFD